MHEIPQQTGRVTELIYTYHTIALAAGFILDLIFGDPQMVVPSGVPDREADLQF